MKTIRIATRKSPLALWQAENVRSLLQGVAPEWSIEFVGVVTEGDRDQTSPLTKIGGKGVFVKALEIALLEQKADIAVHSMKDVPSVLAPGLQLSAVLAREDPRDALLSELYTFDTLPMGARVGTSSLRRRYQLAHKRPDLVFEELRGNVDTRLRRLRSGDFDAIVLAVAGLKRLGLADAITDYLPIETSVPAAGQGAIAIECRDEGIEDLIVPLTELDHDMTALCTSAERQGSSSLFATCDLPVGVHAESIRGDTVRMTAFVSDVEGLRQVRATSEGPSAMVADDLLHRLNHQNVRELIVSGSTPT